MFTLCWMWLRTVMRIRKPWPICCPRQTLNVGPALCWPLARLRLLRCWRFFRLSPLPGCCRCFQCRWRPLATPRLRCGCATPAQVSRGCGGLARWATGRAFASASWIGLWCGGIWPAICRWPLRCAACWRLIFRGLRGLGLC